LSSFSDVHPNLVGTTIAPVKALKALRDNQRQGNLASIAQVIRAGISRDNFSDAWEVPPALLNEA
jgi:hypothetical protein